MQKINPNREDDNFRKIMKEKLEGYSLPVRDDVWSKIEKGLDKKPRKTILWPWISGTAVAAAVALFILLLYPLGDKNKHANNYETTSSLPENTKAINEKVPVETVNPSASISPVKPEKVFVTRETKGEYAEVDSRPEINVTPERHCEDEVRSNLPSDSLKDESGLLRRERLAMTNSDPFGEDTPPVEKSKKRKSISLSLGSGGNLTAANANSTNNLMTNSFFGQFRSNSNAAALDNKSENQLFIEDFPEVTYRIPLSFGLTVKKELNRTFSLETGLVYTFLDSRFENRDLERRALLQLHYIGIPLNVQARILGDKKSDWEVYLSAGGMVEKGIYSHYKQTNYANSNSVLEIVFNERVDGLQYSLSLAPGIDYKIYRNYSIYFEPKISYYFDNNQPISIRTEHPVVIGINAGLRLYW